MRTAPLTYFEESPKPLLERVAERALFKLIEFASNCSSSCYFEEPFSITAA